MTKTCNKCNTEKPLDEFSLNKGGKHGRHSKCKCCVRAYQQINKVAFYARHKTYCDVNKESIAAKKREYYKANKDKIVVTRRAWEKANKVEIASKKKIYNEANKDAKSAYNRAYMEANRDAILYQKREYYEKNKQQIIACRKKYYEKNRADVLASVASYNKKRIKTDPAYKLRVNLRRRVQLAINGQNKSAPTMRLLGCTAEQARQHLESQFADGMTWNNYGLYGWHVDHIIPCASFDLTDPEQQRQCFHYTNLQPLWAKDNLRKSDKLPHEI